MEYQQITPLLEHVRACLLHELRPLGQQKYWRALSEDKGIEFTDRYQALGIPYPDPDTMCKGPCEGTGWVPVSHPNPPPPKKGECRVIRNGPPGEWDEALDKLWYEAEEIEPADDGWHFVKCPACSGTGKSDA